MKKFMKRTGVLLVALCLVASLMPSFALATVVGEVTVDFTTAEITGLKTADCTPPAKVEGEGFAAVESETTTTKGQQTARNFNGVKINLLYIQTAKQSWITHSTPKEAQWTIEVDMKTTEPGWYDISLLGGKWYAAAAYYIYADGQYAGFYDCYDSASGNNPYVDTAETHLNTLYLTPDENGKVKVMFALAEDVPSDRFARFLASKLMLTPTTEPALNEATLDSTVDIPETVTVGTEIPYSASVKLEDGSTRYINGYKADRTVDSDNNFGISLISGSGIEVNDGYIKSTCAGPVKFAVVAKINGTELKSKEYEFTSTITEPEEMVLDFTQNIITAEKAKVAPSGWSFAMNAGYEFVSDKSTASGECQFNLSPIDGTKFVKIQTTKNQWPMDDESGSTSWFTVRKYIGVEGYYQVKMQGAKWYANSRYAIYVNGEYAGDWNSWSGSTTVDSVKKETTATTLNTIYLPKGNVEISFRLRHRLYSSANFMPWYLTLTPVKEDGATLKSVTTSLENTIELSNGARLTGTAQAIMQDGEARHFGYTDSGAIPNIANKEDDVISVSSSNPAVVSAEAVCVEAANAEVKDQTIDPTTTEFTLTANNPGTAVITVTAQVNGETKTATSTVTVPYTDGSDAAPKNVSYIVRGSKTEFNAGIVMGEDYAAGEVGSHPLNTSFTATAKDEITVEGKKYNFAYWQTAGGSPIEGAGASYTFTPKSNFTLEAVYVPATPENTDKKVRFYNYNRAFIEEKSVKEDGTVDGIPTASLAGHTFTGWAAENIGAFDASTEITAALTRVVAQFTADADEYSVKVDGVDVGKYAYGAPFETTADATNGNQIFSHWAIGDKVVSYDSTIRFYVWNNVELTAVYADVAPTAVPTVVLDNIGDEYFITYEAPSGYTAIDAGIVFGTNGTTPRVDSTDGSKASVKQASAKGQFTAAPGDDNHTIARGYVMYKVNATGETRVIYSK